MTAYGERVCLFCGKRFVATSPTQRLCSKECSNARQRAQNAAWCRAHRPRPGKVCPICGKTFFPRSNVQVACSPACREAWKARRAKAREDSRRGYDSAWLEAHSAAHLEPRRDSLGLLTYFDEPPAGARCPLVDDGKVPLDEMVRGHVIGVPSVEQVCAMPRRLRDIYTIDWIFSEYTAARRWLNNKEKKQ